MKYHNKILLKPPKKKMSLLLRCIVIGFSVILGLWCLNYFIFENDLVNFPYFPSSLVLYFHHSFAWMSAILIGLGFVIVFMINSYAWIKGYRKQKLVQYSLATFLWISGIGLGVFLGSVSKEIMYTSLNAISSQLALHVGEITHKQGYISESHTMNSRFQQEIQVKRGKVMARIIDPVSYKFNIQLSLDGKTQSLNQYCYTGSTAEPLLKIPAFKATGTESILGFRCTSGCELYQYFEVKDDSSLSVSNFNACRKVYPKQPALK